MKTRFLIFIAILFASCSEVRFETPQPEKGREVAKFPKEFIGMFYNVEDKDTLIISADEFKYGKELKRLADERVTLKKMGKYYILSTKEILLGENISSMKGWDVLPLQFVNDTLVVSYIELSRKEDAIQERLEQILSKGIKKEYEEEGNAATEYLLINPTKKEFKTILKQEIFNEKIFFVRID